MSSVPEEGRTKRKTLYGEREYYECKVENMPSLMGIVKVISIIVILTFVAAVIPAASAVFDNAVGSAPPCCPNYADYPYYPYPVDPYYQFPAYCLCPFLNASLARFENWNIPYAYWEYIIANQNSSCSTCSGSTSTVSTFSYSNSPLIIPEKDSLMTDYDKISVSTAIKSKDQVLAKYRNY
jgi:hypothetical protein